MLDLHVGETSQLRGVWHKESAMRTSLLVVVFIMGWASTVAARDWYVDNVAGDDRKNGFEAASTNPQDGPVRTIAKALRHARHRDRIILANTGEPYRESISL